MDPNTQADKKVILLVEDDPQMQFLIQETLASQGFMVISAFSGEEALKTIDKTIPNLIISDVMMPGMDGYTLLHRLKMNRLLRRTPVIMLSALGKVEDQLKGLERGAVDYLTKPFKLPDLISKVIFFIRQQERENRQYALGKTLSGGLAQVDVVSLLQMIEQNQKTGLLTVSKRNQEAMLYFKNGQVFDAVLGKLGGEKAIYELLKWDDGHFEFEQKEITTNNRINFSTSHLILEGLRLIDEKQKDMTVPLPV